MNSTEPLSGSDRYLEAVTHLLQRIHVEEAAAISSAARDVASQIAEDRLVHVFGPGGHSNLATQEVFFRAGGLMHMAPMLDEGTLLSNGALRSMAIERNPGYGSIVVRDHRLGSGDLLILVNAYGINAAVIDAALEARARDVRTIGVTSREHADRTAANHPARHPSNQNLHQLVDLVIDSKVPIGDAIIDIDGAREKVAAISTFANAFILNCLMLRTVEMLTAQGTPPPIWRSGNAPGGDEANAEFIDLFRNRIRAL